MCILERQYCFCNVIIQLKPLIGALTGCILAFLLELVPALDRKIIDVDVAEGIDECACKASVGDERGVMVDSCTAEAVSVCELTLGVVLRDVDDEVETVVGNHLHHIVFGCRILIGPHYRCCLDSVLVQELGCTQCSIDVVTLLLQHC